jgi:NADH-ubiquinone oxidoreductase chain 4
MLLLSLLLIPLFGTLFIAMFCSQSAPNGSNSDNIVSKNTLNNIETSLTPQIFNITLSEKKAKIISLSTSILNLVVSLVIFIFFDFSFNQFQFVQEPHIIYGYNLYLGLDGISIYFVLLTTIIVPIALLSN